MMTSFTPKLALRLLCSVLPFAFTTFLVFATALRSKEITLTAIELYAGPAGQSYVQITAVLINDKVELRLCGSSPKIDKSAYGKLTKVVLGVGDSVEYGADGVLTLIRGGNSSCVVPSNLKFEKNAPVTPADLASHGVLRAKVLSSGSSAVEALPPMKPGMKLVFVPAPDVELAEYLRADRSSTISFWQDYLARYPATSHTIQAKESLASLLAEDGERDLALYTKSLASPPSYQGLKSAKLRADQALSVVPNFTPASKLNDDVHGELEKMVAQGRMEMDAYNKALAARSPGYVHLANAAEIADAAIRIDSEFSPVVDFYAATTHGSSVLESSVASAESMTNGKHYDEAYAAIARYRAFAGEVTRISAVVDAVYVSHYDRGQELATAQDWANAVSEFRKAIEVKATAEAASALKDSESGLEALNNKNAAAAALQQSQQFGQQHDYIGAYEVLANLQPAQRSLVAAEMEELSPSYIASASDTAKQIEKAHDPIKGLADEVEIERAYGYLQRAYALNVDPNLKDRIDGLADKLSQYYLEQGKLYLDKPLGSGAGLGWSFLDKALPYKASNLDAIRDELTKAASAYQMRSRLSIRVVFRDQTSRRDSSGFADQLADSIATGLESSGLPVKIIRPGDNPAVDVNFQLVGDVLQHGRTIVLTSVPKDSKYRAGEQDLPNDTWNAANREYEIAVLELQGVQGSLQAIIPKGKQKKIDEANAKVAAAQKKVEEAHVKLDSIPKTLPTDIIKPYTYTEKTIELSAIVQLRFRLLDSSGNEVESTTPVTREARKTFTILENVKPEDTEGVKAQGSVPDEIQFLTDVENNTRDTLIKAVTESAAKLPDKIFEKALKQMADGDNDGAAESFILYLNSTPVGENPNHQRGERFLLEQYNIRHVFSPL